MSYIDDKFQHFLSCPDYKEIAKTSVNTAQMLLDKIITSYSKIVNLDIMFIQKVVPILI